MTTLTELALLWPWPFFTRSDILNRLPAKSASSLDGLVKRAIASGEILHVRKGLYCLSPKYGKKIHPYSLAQRIYGPSYISLEAALSFHGWIPEAVYTVTSVCHKKTVSFETPLGVYSFTRVPQAILFEDVIISTEIETPTLVATPLKALCDYVYVHKKDWSSMRPAIEDLRIELDPFHSLDRDTIESAMNNYKSHRIQCFLKGLRKDLAL